MNEINFGFIDSLYLKFLGIIATEEQKLALGFTMEIEGLSERQTIIRFIEDNLPASLFNEYYIQFPDSIPTIDELLIWTVSQEKTDAETLEFISLIAFDFFAIAVNNIGEAIEFTNASTIPSSENQISTGLQVTVGTVENITYSLIETSFGVDSSLFVIDPITGVTSFNNAQNFENPQDDNADNIYQITVVVSNSLTKKDVFQNISIIVNDANDAPIVDLNQSVDYQENKLIGETLITVAASDEDSSIAGFSIISGNEGGFFNIDNLGNITLTSLGMNSVANNFESSPNNFTLSITATDDQELVSESAEVNLNLIDKEERTFTLIGSSEVTEGQKANYRVVLNGGDMSADSSVILSLVLSNGTALNPADFGDLSQIDSSNHTVTLSGPFNDGDSIIEFELQTVDDILIEGDEDFSVELTSAIINGNVATVSGLINTIILENDFLNFTLTGDSTVNEGSLANYQIQLNGGNIAAGSTVVLSLEASNGSAINPADFGDLAQVNSATNTLTLTGPFNDGDIVANINLLTVADAEDENNESFSVSLTGATIDGNVATALGNIDTTIIDNFLSLTLTGASAVTEGGSANYQVQLNGGNIAEGSTVVLALEAFNGTAINPADFGDLVQVDSNTNTLTLTGPFNDGDIITNINLLTVADAIDEGNENFNVSLVGATIDGNSVTTFGSVDTTIIEIDVDAPLTFTLSGDTSVTEGDTANYNVFLTEGNLVSGNVVTLSLGPIDGTAIEGVGPLFIPSDYLGNIESGAPAIATINGNFFAGDIVAQISVITKPDALSEPTENFSVLLGALSATNGNLITITNTAVVTDIVDLPINELQVTDDSSASTINSLLTAGVDRITVDFTSDLYNGIDFDLSNFSDNDILKFNRNDGLVGTQNSFIGALISASVHVTSATGTGGMPLLDKINYNGASKVSLLSSSLGATVALVNITGLSRTLGANNFEFFTA